MLQEALDKVGAGPSSHPRNRCGQGPHTGRGQAGDHADSAKSRGIVNRSPHSDFLKWEDPASPGLS